MDRFVWFVLLVVMSHLVTEFTRVTGYARGNRHDVVLINDTSLRPMPVANMILYPSEEYGLYDQRISQYSNIYPNTYNSQSNYNNYNRNPNMQPVMSGTALNSDSAATGFTFSFRPIIDSIFEIPISTLRAVNNLVARLTGSYQHQVPSMTPGVPKSTYDSEDPDALQAFRSLQASVEGATSAQTPQPATVATKTENDVKQSDNNNQGNNPIVRVRRSLLREMNA